jgi:RNA-directed DNA polymerase
MQHERIRRPERWEDSKWRILMDEKRQKTEDTVCVPKSQGETLIPATAGIEASVASPQRQSTVAILEVILEPENIKTAIARVQKNGGAPGVDGLTVESLVPYMVAHWDRVRKELENGTYKPKPVRQVEIPKLGGGLRRLGIPTVLDRLIQQAFLQILQPLWDPTFSERSYGFRPGRSQHQAIETAREVILSGFEYVVDLDLEKFFDRVNHDILMARIAQRVEDKRVLKILRAYLTAGILNNGMVEPAVEGVPQGGPLSPLLSNLLLDDLDKELEKRNLEFVRYADDCNIYVKSERAGIRVKSSITKFLEKKLKLKVNEEKSAVGKPQSRIFLGFTFGENPKVPRLIAPTSMKRAKRKIQELMQPSKHRTLEETTKSIGRFLRGWVNYFGRTDRQSDIRTLFGYARRKLRCRAWKNWKTPQKRRQELVRGGVAQGTAYAVSYASKGAWCLSKTPSLNRALNNDYFRKHGFPSSLNGELL